MACEEVFCSSGGAFQTQILEKIGNSEYRERQQMAEDDIQKEEKELKKMETKEFKIEGF